MLNSTLTNADAIKAGLLSDRQIWDIWEHLDRDAKEWCEWLKKPYEGDSDGMARTD